MSWVFELDTVMKGTSYRNYLLSPLNRRLRYYVLGGFSFKANVVEQALRRADESLETSMGSRD